jgi:hypothetical protein
MNKTAHALVVLSIVTAGFAACGGGGGGGPVTPPPAGSDSAIPSSSVAPSASVSPSASASVAPAFAGPMTPVAGSKMLADVQALGIDLKKAPQLAKLEPEKLRKVMKLFAKSLSVKCEFCHADDMAAPTPRKKVAEKMWNEFVVKLAMQDGSPVFCDTCHQNRVLQLDRHDKKALSGWMDDNFVGKMKRRDGKEHECETCHGDPPEYKFLDMWRK